MPRQPFLHDLVAILEAPIQCWSDTAGQATAGGAQGIYCGDDLAVAGFRLDVESHRWDALSHEAAGNQAIFRWLLRTPEEGADPVLSLTRRRSIDAGTVVERIELASVARSAQTVELVLILDPRWASMHDVKAGNPLSQPARPTTDGARDHWQWRDADTHVLCQGDGAWLDDGIGMRWSITLEPGERRTVGWSISLRDEAFPFRAPRARIVPDIDTTGLSPAAARFLTTSQGDLAALQLEEARGGGLQFCAAGAPWFFTLFGRDSLITATLAADAAPELGWRTLRTLAARQGTEEDVDTAQSPGKILHEVRRASNDLHDGSTVLPSEYYGTIDATCLWIMLLGTLAERPDADPARVRELLEPLQRALGWLRDHADRDGDGFLEYFDESGHGLANQGWKDSGDSIRFSDGSLAKGPIRLLEVQGYAFAAARTAARLLAAQGRTDEERAEAATWDAYADAMAGRVREHFWLSDARGPYLALALDADRQPVTGVASNMGHLLGLGLLTGDEERIVVDRLMDETMYSGYGIRTMATDNAAYWPLRYHVGSVWTHDTAWIVRGMLASGFTDEARRVAEGLLRAAEGMGFRAPELFSGQPADEVYPPIPYPASCRPQAWAAASAFVVAEAIRR